MIEPQEISKAFCVAVILPQRILETVFISEQYLRPVRIGFAPEDPTAHVLCFDDKDAEAGHNYMIDLRGTVTRRQDDVVDRLVNFVVQEHSHAQ